MNKALKRNGKAAIDAQIPNSLQASMDRHSLKTIERHNSWEYNDDYQRLSRQSNATGTFAQLQIDNEQ